MAALKYRVVMIVTNSEGKRQEIPWQVEADPLSVIGAISGMLEENQHIEDHPTKFGPPLAYQITIRLIP